MEIRLSPDREARLAAIAASSGRSTDELVDEAVERWEQENARVLAEFRQTLDDAEASIRRGEGIEITRESMRELATEIGQHGRARRAAEEAAKAR
jgi:predicted DNA-binding protein